MYIGSIDISTNSFESQNSVNLIPLLRSRAIPPQITSLSIYPLKSAQGIELNTMDIVETGPRYDREWMLIDENNSFVSQRIKPEMSQLSTQIDDQFLTISYQGFPDLPIPLEHASDSTIDTKLFQKKAKALYLSEEFDQWFSDVLHKPVKLVRSPQEKSRETSGKHGLKSSILFPDGYPLLLTNKKTLDELNSKLQQKITMKRFRPNIVMDGIEANQEESWSEFQINDIRFLSLKSCTRCVIIDINPETAVKSNEVTKTLASYRTKEGQVIFGNNLTHTSTGKIKLGDTLENIR